MKIFIVGASGRVGTKLASILAKMGHQVYAGTRHIEKDSGHENIIPTYIDLHSSQEELIEPLKGMDVIYFVAGSKGKDLLQSDLFGAVKVMQEAESNGTKRFIHLSSIFALEPNRWNESLLKNLEDYNIAKFFSDHWLVHNTNLDYTILQPGALTEDLGTGKIDVNVTDLGSNSIEDVVDVLVTILDYPNTIKKVIKMHEGTSPIKEAIKTI